MAEYVLLLHCHSPHFGHICNTEQMEEEAHISHLDFGTISQQVNTAPIVNMVSLSSRDVRL